MQGMRMMCLPGPASMGYKVATARTVAVSQLLDRSACHMRIAYVDPSTEGDLTTSDRNTTEKDILRYPLCLPSPGDNPRMTAGNIEALV